MRKKYCDYLIDKLKNNTKNNYNIKTLVFEGIFGYGNKQV